MSPIANAPEPKRETPKRKRFVALRTRQVLAGGAAYDLVEGEPVDVPAGQEDDWVEKGWVA